MRLHTTGGQLNNISLDDTFLDNAQQQIDQHNQSQKRKYTGTGLSPKLKDDIVGTLSIRIHAHLLKKLQEMSTKTGVSQRRIVSDCLVHYLDYMEVQHKKHGGFPVY